MSTVKLAAVTDAPLSVNDPVMALVRPTAVVDWPKSVSFTRYPATESPVTDHTTSPGFVVGDGRTWVVGETAEVLAPAVGPLVVEVEGGGVPPAVDWVDRPAVLAVPEAGSVGTTEVAVAPPGEDGGVAGAPATGAAVEALPGAVLPGASASCSGGGGGSSTK